MPAAIPIAAQVAAVVVAKAVGLGAFSGAMIVAGAGLLGSFVATRLQGADSGAQTNSLLDIKLNTATTQRTIPIIYGEQKVGSNDVFIEVTKSSTKHMYIVHCLGEGECDGISQNENGKDLIYVNEKLVHEYDDGLIEYWFHSGANDQIVDPVIHAAFPKFDDPMVNTAYIVFKIKYNKKTFSGVPSRTVILRGIKVKDFRTQVSAWTQNPVVILYDYITNIRYGTGWSEDLLDAATPESSWVSAANYCDLVDESQAKVRYYVDYVIGASLKSQSIIDTLLSHFRGSLSWFGGELKLHYSDLRYEASVAIINDSHIARDNRNLDLVMVSQPNVHSMPDGVSVKFVNKRNGWTIDDFPIGESHGQSMNVQFNAFTDRGLAIEFGTYILERERLNKVIVLTLRPDIIELEINDVVVLSSSELQLTDQVVRVKENSITSDGLSQVVLILEDIRLYNSVYEEDFSSVFTIDLPDPTEAPPPIENITFVEENYEYRKRTFIKLNVLFDEPFGYPWFDHVDVYSRRSLSDDWTILFSSSDDFTLDPVQENTTYYFKLHSVNQFGVKQTDLNAVQVQYTVFGINYERPPSPVYLSATVSATTLDLYSPHLDSPDIDLWEYRVGDSWAGAMFMAAQKFPSISYSAVRPGSYTMWLDTWRSTSPPDGLYSDGPKSADVVVEEPGDPYSKIYEEAVDFVNGTHANTEYIDLGGGAYGLKCSHSTIIPGEISPLVGEYLTQEIDTTHPGVDQILIYLLYTFSSGLSGGTWDDIVPLPDIWESMPSYDTWNSVLSLAGKAARVEIGAYYSTTSGGPYAYVGRLEILTASVIARYVKLKFRIEDYSDDAYIELGQTFFIAASKP